MKMMNSSAGLRHLALALFASALLAPRASASALIDYTSAGTIGSTGITGTPVVSFNNTSAGSFNAPSDFSLGDFHVTPLADGQSTTYTNTPFQISLTVNQIDGSAPEPNQTPVTLSGVLNGTVTGPNQSTVVAQFNPGATPDFVTGSATNTLSVFDNPLSLVPSTTNGGLTSAQAYLNNQVASVPPLGGTQTVPEPTSVLVFSAGIAVVGLIRRRRLGRSGGR